MTDSLRQTLDATRAKMKPTDCLTLCRSGNEHACRHNCPGPGEDGSLCYEIEGDDPRDSETIAREIEGLVFPRQ